MGCPLLNASLFTLTFLIVLKSRILAKSVANRNYYIYERGCPLLKTSLFTLKFWLFSRFFKNDT